jgi:hypothetical protein
MQLGSFQRTLIGDAHAVGTQRRSPRNLDMQTDLQDFLARIARTILMTLIPVALVAFVTMPASLHHHIGSPTPMQDTVPQHMT